MLGEGILKGLVETARNFFGSFVSKDRLTTVQFPEERRAPAENARNFPFLVYDGDNWEVVSPPDSYQPVLDAVKALGIEPAAAEVALLPKNYIKLEGKAAQQMLKLMEILEEHEDTKKVWTNADIEEKEIEASLA